MFPLEVRVIDDAHAMAIWGSTLIQVYRGPATGTSSSEANRIGMKLVATSRDPATSIMVLENESPPPEDEVRKNFATFSRDVVSRMAVGVIVSEGGGFRGAVVRAIGVALTNLLPHGGNFKFVNDIESGVRLIAPHLSPSSGGAEALAEAIETLRNKIGTTKFNQYDF